MLLNLMNACFAARNSEKTGCKLEKISASYRYALLVSIVAFKRFDFLSPTLLHMMTPFAF